MTFVLVEGRLYFSLLGEPPAPHHEQHQLFFDLNPYVSLSFADKPTGPVSLSCLYHFFRGLNALLQKEKRPVLCWVSNSCDIYCSNALFATLAFASLFMGLPIAASIDIIHEIEEAGIALSGYRDVFSDHEFTLSIADCVLAVVMATLDGIVDLHNFDVFLHEDLYAAGISVVVPDKLVALASPHDHPEPDATPSYLQQHKHAGWYVERFEELNVKSVVRLNSPLYEPHPFTQKGINHFDLCFEDGGLPSLQITSDFLFICEATKGCVAVHCLAGLGRTGTCICLYLMKHYLWPAAQAIAWLRIVRPGSVMHQQQTYLLDSQVLMWEEGLRWRGRQSSLSYPLSVTSGISPFASAYESLLSRAATSLFTPPPSHPPCIPFPDLVPPFS